MRGRLFRAAAVAALSETLAAAADPPLYCPGDATQVRTADKSILARTVLDAAKVSRDLEERVAASRALPDGLAARQAIAGYGRLLCRSDRNPQGIVCRGDDAARLDDAVLSLDELFDDPRFQVAGSRDPRRFFAEDASQLRCLPETVVATADATDEAVPWYRHVRVRGAATDLIYANTSDAYSDVGKATLAFGADATKDKTTKAFILAVGYAFAFGPGMDAARTDYLRFGAIPYAGLNVDTSRTKGVKDVSSDQLEIGTALQATFIRPATNGRYGVAPALYLALIPGYVVDYADNSRLLKSTAIARPIFAPAPGVGVNRLNPIGRTALRWDVILDVRGAYGHFTRTGTRTGDDALDFARVGGRFGLGLSNQSKALPIDATLTDTVLWALDGRPARLDLVETALTVYFDADRHFGLDLSYAKGRASDLDEKVDKWSIGFAAKY